MTRVASAPGVALEPAVAFISRLLPLNGAQRHAVVRKVSERIESRFPALPPPPQRKRKRLRVGVLSPDFREHLNAYLLRPLFELADRARFEMYAYSLATDDGSRARAAVRDAADAFRDLQPLPDAEAALAIRDDDVDILLDVGGHTTDARFAITAQRPARVQVNYLGFSCSLASTRVDYAIVDRVTGGDGNEWTEARVFLPDTHFLYDYRSEAPPGSFHDYDNILSARFFARKTTDDAAILTASEIRNKTIPMKNST
jgi:predicted O-linked N-acetylglucosamine transferase (SPINDLY family)